MRTKASVLAFFLLLFLAGCMNTTTTVKTTSDPLPTTLHVVRPAVAEFNITSFKRTVSNTGAVQRLYKAAEALPKVTVLPPCASGDFLIYNSTFLIGTKTLQEKDVQPTACQFVFIGAKDIRKADQDFLNLFAQTIGLPSLIPAGIGPVN
jgi:hypothetical protein